MRVGSAEYRLLKAAFDAPQAQDHRRHSELLQYLEEELGAWLAPDWLGRAAAPNDLWRLGKRLLLTYSHDPSSAYNDRVWPEVQHAWGDKRTGGDLYRFLDGKSSLHLWSLLQIKLFIQY